MSGGTATARSSDAAAAQVRALAADAFGWERLRPGQAEAMEALVEGRDVVVVMPTGYGKSAVYQVAALARAGTTVVVTPLISLQEDQLAGLERAGWPAAEAIAINSGRRAAVNAESWRRLRDGEVEFAFVSPEQLANADVVDRLAASGPSLLVVDEAHCVSSWGHDFRPDYLRVADVHERLGRPPVAALTATAAPPVREEVVERLRLRDPVEVVAGFDRPNITLAVRRFSDARQQREQLIELVAGSEGPGIVYAATRADTEGLAKALHDKGLRVQSYHAGRKAVDRTAVHEAFLAGALDVVVATSAFGMGIDAPHVRYVVHASITDSLDTYYQEFGRAGRDGEPAAAVLFYRSEDLGLRTFFGSGSPDVEVLAAVCGVVLDDEQPAGSMTDLAKRLGLSRRRVVRAVNLLEEAAVVRVAKRKVVAAERDLRVKGSVARALEVAEARTRRERSRLEMMRGYAETSGCRRRYLLGYFGEELAENCGRCDTCWDGSAAREEERAAEARTGAPDALEVDDRVRHAAWGPGTVMSLEPHRLTVFFDSEGYKTLDRETVAEEGLLVSAGRAARDDT